MNSKTTRLSPSAPALAIAATLWAATLMAQPSITTPPAGQTVAAGANAFLSVAVGGTGPFSYQWQFNGTNLPNHIITTVAGGRTGGTTGDGGPATNAALSQPWGVAVDTAGNVYIADCNNQRVRKVDTQGIITTVAGKGSSGLTGDGGAATNANLDSPVNVAVDGAGNLYIADQSNFRVRKVGTNGVITTFAGGAGPTESGDGGLAVKAGLDLPGGLVFDLAGNLYIADLSGNRVRMADTNGTISSVAGHGLGVGFSGDGGPATNALINHPTGLALDSAGNLFIADGDNNRVRRVDLNGTITTVAGNGSTAYSGDGAAATNASLNYPWGLAVDAFGGLYIAEQNGRIRKVDTNGIISTVAGNPLSGVYPGDGGDPTNASIPTPRGLALDAAGNLYIGDGNDRVRKVIAYAGYPTLSLQNVALTNAGTYSVVVTSPAGSATSSVALLTVTPVPPVITAQPTNQIVSPGANASLSVTATGPGPLTYQWQCNGSNLPPYAIQTVAGTGVGTASGDGAPATSAGLTAQYVALDPAGDFWIADWGNNRIRRVDAGGTITTVAGTGAKAYSGDGGPATNAALYVPTCIARDSAGNLYVADQNNHRIRRLDPTGTITTVAGSTTNGYFGDGGPATNALLNYPHGVTVGPSNTLFIADESNQRVRKVDPNGTITTVAGNGGAGYAGDGGPAVSAKLYNPVDVAVDSVGNLFIAEFGNNRIRKVATNGVITTVAGTGAAAFAGDGGVATNAALCNPAGVAVDAFGNLYIADKGTNRVRRVDLNGMICTVAGTGKGTYAGDGGDPAAANLSGPSGLAFDASGNLFIADYWNNRVRELVGYPAYPTVGLTGVSPANAGAYTVVVSSPYGSVTSAVATLTIARPPTISGIVPEPDGSVTLGFTGTPTASYRVWAATNLIPPVAWFPIATNVPGAEGTWQINDPGATQAPGRFYRASVP